MNQYKKRPRTNVKAVKHTVMKDPEEFSASHCSIAAAVETGLAV